MWSGVWNVLYGEWSIECFVWGVELNIECLVGGVEWSMKCLVGCVEWSGVLNVL